jgi:hypothetical protein
VKPVKTFSLVLACSVIAAATPALAHHSFAMFDMAKTVTLKGTVKELQWTNPHIWRQIVVPQAAGPAVEWSLEAGKVAVMKRSGWTRDSLKAGDVVTIAVHPGRAAGLRGSLASVALADGRVLKSTQGGAPPTVHSIEGQP